MILEVDNIAKDTFKRVKTANDKVNYIKITYDPAEVVKVLINIAELKML